MVLRPRPCLERGEMGLEVLVNDKVRLVMAKLLAHIRGAEVGIDLVTVVGFGDVV